MNFAINKYERLFILQCFFCICKTERLNGNDPIEYSKHLANGYKI